MEYAPYKNYDIYDMINEPRRISKDPYKLHAAFMLNCLFEVCPDDEDGNPQDPNRTWGWTVPKAILQGIVKNGNEQFIEACNNSLQIDIWGHLYSIRHASLIEYDRLNSIFQFKENEGNCIIEKSGIMNLSECQSNKGKNITIQVNDNIDYLNNVVSVAEDDEHDGWDKLTDMEVTIYLWYLYKLKHTDNNYSTFRKRFKSDLYTTEQEEKACWNDKAQTDNAPTGLYLFAAEKVRMWNKRHRQQSVINKVDET